VVASGRHPTSESVLPVSGGRHTQHSVSDTYLQRGEDLEERNEDFDVLRPHNEPLQLTGLLLHVIHLLLDASSHGGERSANMQKQDNEQQPTNAQ
jgi:hypothetical protein